jgi:chemotaxis signal transduction protein
MGTVAARISQRLVAGPFVRELSGMAKISEDEIEHIIGSGQTANSSVLSGGYRKFQVALAAEIYSLVRRIRRLISRGRGLAGDSRSL